MQMHLRLPALATILTVSQLSQRIRQTLDTHLDEVWVVGEVSNLRVPPSGHLYFCLKDRRSQVAAVMFRSANQLLPFRPEDGMEVVVRGRVAIYEARGDLQLCVENMEPRGLGSVQLGLEQLKKRLAAEGLFADSRKRPLPFLPQAVGIVTALRGAAIHDLLTTLHARAAGQCVVIRPVRVQGKAAGADIAQAIADLNAVGAVEVIIVGRGGGSVEDLWAFNEERVARAIAASRVPVVSAVGHEIDVTIADLVADRRAATPTAAAALVVPDRRDLLRWVDGRAASMEHALRRHIRRQREHLQAQARHLRDPRQVLRALQMRIDELTDRAQRALAARLRFSRQQLRGCAERLQALSPLAVLQRGYSIARRVENGAVVRDAQNLVEGDRLVLTFARGHTRVRVDN
jgi:exodeoxyribonuclease VII large subunit